MTSCRLLLVGGQEVELAALLDVELVIGSPLTMTDDGLRAQRSAAPIAASRTAAKRIAEAERGMVGHVPKRFQPVRSGPPSRQPSWSAATESRTRPAAVDVSQWCAGRSAA
jgi:hypothetical protein